MGLLVVTLQCIYFLLWPILAVGYPLYVSLRTVEIGCSKDQMRKLVAYWTIFSFMYLFEQAFGTLIRWVPLWPYLKLIAICWLMIPQFNGASCFYESLIRPCLQMKLPDAITQFNATCSEWVRKLEDSSIKKETFLAVAERYLGENGSEARAELIDGKVGTVEGNQLQLVKTSSAIHVNETAIPASLEVIKLPETSFIQNYQTKWTCTMCQVTTSSQLTLQSHLLGRRHREESKLWCNFCNLRCSKEIDMIAHLKGKKHLAKLQETFAA